jgi:ABC-type nickel/cobalt efflux system permease component RcnA
MEKRRRIIIAVVLMLSVVNYSRLKGNENIRLIQFISIFAIGALAALLIREVVTSLRAKKINKE